MEHEIELGIDGLSNYEEIGSGGFAVAYSAYEAEQGRLVAVKVLASIDESGRRRFDRERLTMGQTTDHTNIVTLFRSGYTSPGNRPYLVMEYLSGGSLQDRIDRDGPLRWDEAIELILPVADALGYSHAAGIVHKDVKPANLLVSGTGVVKLADFGIAVVKEATVTSQVAYSPAYTPPETFDARRDPASGELVDPRDERSDLYSLAAGLYALGTGDPPFQSPTSAGLMSQISKDPVPATGHPGLDRFFAMAMAKQPSDRYQTAAHFVENLKGTRDQLADVTLRPVAVPDLSSPPVGDIHQVTTTSNPMPEAGSRRRLARWLFASILLAAVVALFLVSGWLGPDPSATTATTRLDAAVTSTTGEATSSTSTEEPEDVGSVVFGGHRGHVLALIGLPDGRLVSGDSNGSILVWSPDDLDTSVGFEGHPGPIGHMLALSDGRVASTGRQDGTILIWDPTDSPTTRGAYTGHADAGVTSMIQLTDGRIASVAGALANDQSPEVHIWDPDDPEVTLSVLTGVDGWVHSLVETDEGHIAIARRDFGVADGLVAIWNPDNPGSAAVRHGRDAERMARLVGGRIASNPGGRDIIEIWESTDPESTLSTYRGHSPSAKPMVFLQLENGQVVSSNSAQIRIWDPDDIDETIAVYTEHSSLVSALVQLTDGRVASASEDGTVQIWGADEL